MSQKIITYVKVSFGMTIAQLFGKMKLRKLSYSRTTRLEAMECSFENDGITPSSHTYPYLAAAGRRPAAAVLAEEDPFLLYKQYVYQRFNRESGKDYSPGNRESSGKFYTLLQGYCQGRHNPWTFFSPGYEHKGN
jgi:hypothetical protein